MSRSRKIIPLSIALAFSASLISTPALAADSAVDFAAGASPDYALAEPMSAYVSEESIKSEVRATAAAVKVPETFTYNGGGWGHGVGMSQYGAYGMALEGKTAKQILEHYYNPAKLVSDTSYASSDIRVQLVGGVTSTTVTPNSGQLRLKFDDKTINTSKTAKLSESSGKIDIEIEGKKYTTGSKGVIVEWQNTRFWSDGSSKTTVSIPKTNDGYGTGSFRHGKISVAILNGKLNVVNTLRLNDEYLYGLAEVPSSWPSATLQTQAIAGRTYAQRNMSLKSACDCNVYDEVKSQKFTGWSKENESNGIIGAKWVAAVNATQNKRNGVPTNAQVMKHNGKLIDAVYSSSTGGKTRSAKDVWGGDHAYLQSRDDKWALKPELRNPNAKWAYSVSQSTAARGYGLSDVSKISIKRADDLTLISSTATSVSGKTATLDKHKTRSLFGAKSVWATNIVGSGTVNVGGDSNSSGIGDLFPQSPGGVKPIETDTAANIRYVTKANLNFRSGPGTSYSILKVLKSGEQVITSGKKSGGWLQVKTGVSIGWVSSELLSLYEAPNVTPKPPVKPIPKPPTITTPKPSPKPVSKPSVKPKPTTVKTVKYTLKANLTVRASASSKGKKLGVITKNSKIDVSNISKGWAKITYKKKTAYVSSSYIKKYVEPKVITKKTTVKVNMRSSANTKSKSILLVPKNKSVSLTGKKSGKWFQVKYEKKTGWILGSYLK